MEVEKSRGTILVVTVAWHQDSMRVNEELEYHPRPRLSLKVGYYLTDTRRADWGNTLLLPGSHQTDRRGYGRPLSCRKTDLPVR
jgi:ectoine hydroxylase-related dioxygenase (phytanoyl-CoA dioxygenase family)